MTATATAVRKTVVSFHAHPDDEALLTGGTLAGGTYGYKVTAVNANGETAGSAEQSLTTTSENVNGRPTAA